jgi:hypothetical protein
MIHQKQYQWLMNENSPKVIAEKIDWLYGQNIEKYSKLSDEYAESIDWKVLKDKILQLFK